MTDVEVDFESAGLRAGLEVHRQLDTKHKLFCGCSTEEPVSEARLTFLRRLREAQSELGRIDPAAIFEARKEKTILYSAPRENTCLVEMDEEPPHPLDEEAIEAGLRAALLFNSQTVDEIHVMRKIVIDGSNTAGFQRTCTIALGGFVKVDGEEIPIQTISLEEDAARLLEAKRREVHYDLSRLGIPLIEVSTAPVITNPKQALQVAYQIGRTLRSTGNVKRGLGTVRQDLNISISGGGLIEIKGIQELELIPIVIEKEVRRQLHLLNISRELKSRKVSREHLTASQVNVTEVFRNTRSKVIAKKTSEGGMVLATKLLGFGGLLSGKDEQSPRLGAELNGHARAWSDVEGIFHTDELPGYGIGASEVEEIRRLLGTKEHDAAIITADDEDSCRYALEAVVERARQAIDGVPGETRAARPDGTTVYMRPRPGSARMYPETDIPPIPVPSSLIGKLKQTLPEPLDRTIERIAKKHDLTVEATGRLVDLEKLELFEKAMQRTRLSPGYVASVLAEQTVMLKREGLDVTRLSEDQFLNLFAQVDEGVTAKEAAPEILRWLASHPSSTVQEAVSNLGITTPSLDLVRQKIAQLVDSRIQEVLKESYGVEDRLMGELMKEFRGKVNGKLLNELLREEINRRLGRVKS